MNVISSKNMLKVNSGEKTGRRRSMVSFAEEATIIGVSEEAETEEQETAEENKTGPSLRAQFICSDVRTCNE